MTKPLMGQHQAHSQALPMLFSVLQVMEIYVGPENKATRLGDNKDFLKEPLKWNVKYSRVHADARIQQEPEVANCFEMHVRSCYIVEVASYIITWTSKKMALHLAKRARTETDSYNVLLRIKHSMVEKCFCISLHPFLRCLDKEQAHYEPFSHCQYLQV